MRAVRAGTEEHRQQSLRFSLAQGPGRAGRRMPPRQHPAVGAGSASGDGVAAEQGVSVGLQCVPMSSLGTGPVSSRSLCAVRALPVVLSS